MLRLAVLLAGLATASNAFAAAVTLQTQFSEDDGVCEYFRTRTAPAPIKWEALPNTPEAKNFRAIFDFENTGTPVEVRRREDESPVFFGTYFLIAPKGAKVPPNWFDDLLDPTAGFRAPPEGMRMYWQDDLNSQAEIALYNKKHYLRTIPGEERLTGVMILEPRDGKLHLICRYQPAAR